MTTRNISAGSRGIRALLPCILALTSIVARADIAVRAVPADPFVPSIADAFSLHGFGTVGGARSSSGQADFVRDLSQPDGTSKHWSAKIDSLVGLQANYRHSDRIEGVAQVVSRHGNEGNFEPEVMWAFVKYEPSAQLTLRAGRLGTDFFMLADSRLVGYSYLPVRPPNDYFGTLPFQHIDGLDGVTTFDTAMGLLRAKLFAGHLDGEVPSVGKQWNLQGSRMAGANMDIQAGDWLWRIGYAQVRFKRNIRNEELLSALEAAAVLGVPNALGVRDALSVREKLSRFYSAGVVYDHGPLQLQVMLSRIRQESAAFQNTDSGYLIAGYRRNAWTPYVGYSRARSSTRHLPSTLPALDPYVSYSVSRSHTDQHTGFLGVRWDFLSNYALKAQYDVIRGNASSIFPFQRISPNWNGRTKVLGVTLDFVF